MTDGGREQELRERELRERGLREPELPELREWGLQERERGLRERELLARIALARTIEPGDESGGRWLRAYGARGTVERIAAGDDSLTGVKPGRLIGLGERLLAARPERDLAAAAACGARFVIPGDAEWPVQLDDLGDARPIGLWVRGQPSLRIWALRSVALVGSRACTPYGAHMAQTLGAGLAERGWVVVSGGAFGIDGAAHRGALCEGGATVAVLACGVDRVYPAGHKQLLARIAEQGLLVSELSPGSHPTRYRFIQRNRVIAALTRGTVVVEAALRSGALVTVRRAQRLGRHVMGVPGPATSRLSAGVHQLLRGEGMLVTDAADVVELVGEMGDLAPERRGPVVPRDLLAPTAARVLEALPARGVATAKDIARGAQSGVDETVGRLYELQSLGFVERHGDGWQLTRQKANPVCAGRKEG
ncbi:DNA-protecting protein DprA [Streptomyces sp. TRM66268-LWL]|uniref:DNA-protecting protein DprA n=1 Tax=Streptomyces polyasparticus TaxID=2767826 RepID=A0ABR7SBG4_9ACTN|nr:DNA-processing protein DprA [Streptomyces polyasparticus]MBC9711668.1 DNA-protecting protein DprA [Streptomyces polyasparticus]